MRYICIGAVVLMSVDVSTASAQDNASFSLSPRFSGDARLRYQAVDRGNALQSGEALTLRLRGGIELDLFEKTTFLADIENVTAFIADYNDGTGDNPLRPFIPDPEGFELNRFQLVSEAIPDSRITVGRQRIALDDWRFIGAFPFRQNNQSFDALRLETKAFGPGNLDIGYFNKVRRPLGEDNIAGVFSGDSFYLHYNLATLIGRVSAFHYATDLEIELPGPLLPLFSTQTTGARVLGRRDWDDFSLIWEGSYARQSDYRDNPNNFNTNYGLAAFTVRPNRWTFKARAEILGSDNGQALQTPLASLHRFQGFTDQFLRTPNDGIRDYSLFLQHDFGDIGPFSNVKSFIRHHWFEADTDGRNYGREVNLSLKANVKKTKLAVEYGDYKADQFSNDTKVLFLTTEFSF